jgi:N-acetylneuraminate lyase
VLSFVKEIAAAAPTTPYFYYHIPSLTRTEISVAELFRMARDGPPSVRVPTLMGVKYAVPALVNEGGKERAPTVMIEVVAAAA